MLERTLVYVDTSYLLASFYNSWETGARGQLEIDLREVVHVLDRMITAQLDQPVQRQLWYDGLPESGPHRYQRQLRTIDGVRLRAGQLIEWGDRRTQKAVDTRLVADMVIAALREQVTDMVLVSGDADMLPGVNEAAGAGVRVHLYGFGWDSMSSALRHACDTTTILDPREDFAECMQLNVLEGPLPPVVRAKPVGDAEPPEDLGATPVAEFRGGADRTGGAAEGSTPAPEVAKDPDPAPADGGDGAPAPATPTARAPEPQPTPDAGARPGSAAAAEPGPGDPAPA
ncbi:NYN domain-containing protein, partial [Corynebacterium sphenisci]|uniref:NYN domain-containing protein n=1 Tax=Corynebacterium sphenisci TaxID=191493 RepID=UPI0026DF1719